MNTDINVKDFMSKDLFVISEETKVLEFSKSLEPRKVHHVLVENGQKELVGVISNVDINRNNLFLYEEGLLAKHIMTEELITLTEDAILKDALKIFLENYVRSIPIMSVDNQVTGIVTPYDIMYLLNEDLTK